MPSFTPKFVFPDGDLTLKPFAESKPDPFEQALVKWPAKMIIQNLDDPNVPELRVQFNPAGFEEIIGTNYAKLTSPGLSHQHLQFIGTNNLRYNLTLYFNAKMSSMWTDGKSMPDRLEALQYGRRYLHSLCYPRSNAVDVGSGGAPRVLFMWPGMVSIQAVIEGDITFKYTDFTREGLPWAFTADLSLTEIRDLRISSEDVLLKGTKERS